MFNIQSCAAMKLLLLMVKFTVSKWQLTKHNLPSNSSNGSEYVRKKNSTEYIKMIHFSLRNKILVFISFRNIFLFNPVRSCCNQKTTAIYLIFGSLFIYFTSVLFSVGQTSVDTNEHSPQFRMTVRLVYGSRCEPYTATID